jgi:hypothetical protein
MRAVGREVVVRTGAPVAGPATGVRDEVFIHASRFEDRGGVTADGAHTSRRSLDSARDTSLEPARARASMGYAEERPAMIVVDVTCVSGSYRQMQQLCAAVTPVLLVAFETLRDPMLAGVPNASVAVQFADFTAVLHACETTRYTDDLVASHRGRLTFHLEGFVHLTVTWKDGPGNATRPRVPPTLAVEFDPKGIDSQNERVVIRNAGDVPLDLTGWVLRDDAKRPHRFVFPAVGLAPGAVMRVWTKAGTADAGNLYWGRRRPVWNHISGDCAVLLDRAGTEVVRVSCKVPKPKGTSAPRSDA